MAINDNWFESFEETVILPTAGRTKEYSTRVQLINQWPEIIVDCIVIVQQRPIHIAGDEPDVRHMIKTDRVYCRESGSHGVENLLRWKPNVTVRPSSSIANMDEPPRRKSVSHRMATDCFYCYGSETGDACAVSAGKGIAGPKQMAAVLQAARLSGGGVDARSTRSRISFPALKCGTDLPGTLTSSPLLGLRPVRGGR